MSFFERSINNYLTKKAAKEISGLDPRVQDILNGFFPGIAGGVSAYQDNAFFKEQMKNSKSLADSVVNAGLIKTSTSSGEIYLMWIGEQDYVLKTEVQTQFTNQTATDYWLH